MIDKTSTVLIVALISILGLTSCIRYNVAEPLDRFSSPEMGTADGNEITVTAGSTWFAEGEYENFILTGQSLCYARVQQFQSRTTSRLQLMNGRGYARM